MGYGGVGQSRVNDPCRPEETQIERVSEFPTQKCALVNTKWKGVGEF